MAIFRSRKAQLTAFMLVLSALAVVPTFAQSTDPTTATGWASEVLGLLDSLPASWLALASAGIVLSVVGAVMRRFIKIGR